MTAALTAEQLAAVLRRRAAAAPRRRPSWRGWTPSCPPGGRPVPADAPRRSCARARCATCTRWTTTGCCWSRRTACPRSTWCCPRPSPTRAACSRACRASGSRTTRGHRGRPPAGHRPGGPAGGPAARPGAPSCAAGCMICRRRARRCRSSSSCAATCRASGWKDYQRTGAVSGVRAAGRPARERPAAGAVFTPSTKAEAGHDENIDFDAMVGARRRTGRRSAPGPSPSPSTASAPRTRRARGIILADTKFELGILPAPRRRADDDASRARG